MSQERITNECIKVYLENAKHSLQREKKGEKVCSEFQYVALINDNFCFVHRWIRFKF